MFKIIYNISSYILIIAIITGCTSINEESNSQNTAKYTINGETYIEEEENKYI